MASPPGPPGAGSAGRRSWIVLGSLALGLVLACLGADLPTLSRGEFWNDGATYYTMAWSLAVDHDLRFEAKDLERVRQEFPSGPEGIFLKRASDHVEWDRAFPWLRLVSDREAQRPIYFAKPFVYPAVVAPFVWLLGTRGFLVANALCLSVTLALAFSELRRRVRPAWALPLTLVLVGASVTPLYVLWLTPEILSLALSTAAIVSWLRGRAALSAVLLGVATYSKPPNLFLALPLCLEPLLQAARNGAPGAAAGALRESLRRGALLVLVAVALFGINKAVTGDWNYQGGERKTFYRDFPFDSPRTTFGNSGFWMTTEHIGPVVQGEGEAAPTRGAIVRPGAEIRDAFVRNLAYFWVGRFGGALAYYLPALLAVSVFLGAGPRTHEGWLAVLALGTSYLFYIWLIPDNWYGGGGTVGNRYFVSLLPLTLALVPRGREAVVSVAGGLLGLAFVTPILASPLESSLHPGRHALKEPFLSLPAELTMLNDLSVFTEPWRKKRPFGNTDYDIHAYYLYFPDDGTYGKESGFGGEGFWLKEGARAEVILRALEPVRSLKVRVNGAPGGNRITLRVGSRAVRLLAGEAEIGAAVVEPGPPYVFYDSFVYRLVFRTEPGGLSGSAEDGDPRPRGGFVRIALSVSPRPKRR